MRYVPHISSLLHRVTTLAVAVVMLSGIIAQAASIHGRATAAAATGQHAEQVAVLSKYFIHPCERDCPASGTMCHGQICAGDYAAHPGAPEPTDFRHADHDFHAMELAMGLAPETVPPPPKRLL